MTPEEKAHELVEKYIFDLEDVGRDYQELRKDAKQCARICVGEMLQLTPMYTGGLNPQWSYLNEVKQEIEKL